MIESIIPMTAGLLLDICGGFLIVRFFLGINTNLISTHVLDTWKHPDLDPLTADELADIVDNREFNDIKNRDIQVSNIKWGFAFLAIGFFLILIASWIDYLK